MQSPTSLNRFTVVGVALISSTATLVTRYTLWGSVVGITFLLVLYAYGQISKDASVLECAAYSATQAICVALILSWLPNFIPLVLGRFELLFGGLSLRTDSQELWYFLIWLVLFVVGFVIARRR